MQVPLNSFVVSSVEIKIWNCLSCIRLNASVRRKSFVIQSIRSDRNVHSSAHGFYLPNSRKFTARVRKALKFCVSFRDRLPVNVFQFVVGVMLFMAIAVPVAKSPSCKFLLVLAVWRLGTKRKTLARYIWIWLCIVVCIGALTEENLLFLEAWRTIDRAYVDKTFNGQSWFRYRENALRNEPMNNREETCMSDYSFVDLY